MSAETIYRQLIKAGLSKAGACGMMGNMQAESALRANNAQDGMTRLSDAEYTSKFDSDPESCYKDAVGYGLCQWTYWSRKQGLYNHCKLLGESVGSEEAQVSFCIQELKSGYPGLFGYLCSTDSVYTAASRICTEYEKPAVNNITERVKYANEFYDRFNETEVSTVKKADTPTTPYWPPRVLAAGMKGADVMVLQALLTAQGEDYAVNPDGIFGNTTGAKLEAFQKAKALKADKIAGEKTWNALTVR